MKFYNYINERSGISFDLNTDVSQFNEFIHKNCKYYLQLTQGIYIFKRGLNHHTDSAGKKDVRQNRRPRGMQDYIFEQLNDWLEKNNHVRRDKAVIAANIKNNTSMFGDVYWIFPIGKFDYTWLMAGDMNMSDPNTGWDSIAPIDFFRHGYSDEIIGNFEDYFVTNSSLKTAWMQKYEIWFNCKQYYYFSVNDFGWNAKKKELVKWDS